MFLTEEQTTELRGKFELTELQLNELDAEFRAYDTKGGLQKFSIPRFNTKVFNHEIFTTRMFHQGVKKFTLEKSSSWFIVEKSGVEKSRVETSCNQKAMALF